MGGRVRMSFSSAGISLGALLATKPGANATIRFTRNSSLDGQYLLHWDVQVAGLPDDVWDAYLQQAKARYGPAASIDALPGPAANRPMRVAIPEAMVASAPLRFATRFIEQAAQVTGRLTGDRMELTFEFADADLAEEVAGRIAAHVPRLEAGVTVSWEVRPG